MTAVNQPTTTYIQTKYALGYNNVIGIVYFQGFLIIVNFTIFTYLPMDKLYLNTYIVIKRLKLELIILWLLKTVVISEKLKYL